MFDPGQPLTPLERTIYDTGYYTVKVAKATAAAIEARYMLTDRDAFKERNLRAINEEITKGLRA